MSERNAKEEWDAQNLQRAYIEYRRTRGKFGTLPPAWQKIDPWVKVVRKAFERGIEGGDNILAALVTASDGAAVLPTDIHRLMSTASFELVARCKDLMHGEADDMRELGMDPSNPDDVNKFHIREWVKAALRTVGNVAGTHDTKSNVFVHALVYDITRTAPFLRYLLGWRSPEVDRECGEAARQFFKEKRHLAKACVALGWPKEIIAPDFEL